MFGKLISTGRDCPGAIIRIASGIVFFAHGAQKLLGWFHGAGFAATMRGFTNGYHIPAPIALLPIIAEFFGGLGLIIGFLTRIAAFGLICDMVVAVWLVHWQNGFFMNWGGRQKGEGIEFHIIAIAALIYPMIRGGGSLSVDGLLSKRR
jgi:putative oxidoreductase